jgi:hypothetical protein
MLLNLTLKGTPNEGIVLLMYFFSDPLRVLKGTESTLASKQQDQPHLYTLHTYSSEDITNDKRYKIEQALRSAGTSNLVVGLNGLQVYKIQRMGG